MAPKAKPAAKAPKTKPAAKATAVWVAAGNKRGRQRRDAVLLLNGLAGEVGAKPVRLKAAAGVVEKLARLLDTRCQAGDLPDRLRAAVTLHRPVGSAGRSSISTGRCLAHARIS